MMRMNQRHEISDLKTWIIFCSTIRSYRSATMSSMKLIRRTNLESICLIAVVLILPSYVFAGSTLVVCAPGFPGSTAEAQSTMDGFAALLAETSGWQPEDLNAVYFEKETPGVDRLEQEDAALAMVTLPFFLEHHERLALRAIAQAVPSGRAANEPWTLVAGKGRIRGPGDLAAWKITSLGGHSSQFVRGAVFDGWGPAPPELEVVFSNRVLTSLRRAVKGENLAVLLDGEQAAALDRLPFADDLEVIRSTEAVPVSLMCSVADRLPEKSLTAFSDGIVGLDDDATTSESLAGVRLDRFEALDSEALQRAIAAFERAGK